VIPSHEIFIGRFSINAIRDTVDAQADRMLEQVYIHPMQRPEVRRRLIALLQGGEPSQNVIIFEEDRGIVRLPGQDMEGTKRQFMQLKPRTGKKGGKR